ncbi:MAG: DUF4912 domain-containing protein, partial [Elusimicrobiota bacterium]|nr:DUF4912 domain-containing protein [Elusimicrobiota bacterium]
MADNLEERLSSTAALKFDHQAAKEAHFDLPQTYGVTESYLLPKDPAWMYLFWAISKETYEFVMSERGGDIFAKSVSVIRTYDITGVDNFDGGNAVSFFDTPVVLDALSWYIGVPQGGRRYICDIGLITPGGEFILLTRSNPTAIPGGRISDVVDEKWMLVEGDYRELLKLSGADNWGL